MARAAEETVRRTRSLENMVLYEREWVKGEWGLLVSKVVDEAVVDVKEE